MAFSKEQREAFSRRAAKALELDKLSTNRPDRFLETLNRERRVISGHIHSRSRTAASSNAKLVSNKDINILAIGGAEQQPAPQLTKKLELAQRIQKDCSARTRQFCLKLANFDSLSHNKD